MIDEIARKKIVVEHSRRLSAGDLDGLMEMYTEDVTFEDPVGAGRQRGRETLRQHFAQCVEAGISETVGEPVAGQDGLHALVPVLAVMDYLPKGPAFAERGWLVPPPDAEGRRLACAYVLVLRTGVGGLIEDLRAFWGRADLELTR
ncbi:nuclear transport factor 2 family protein [Streptomyces smyrnaeus]|uniref:nuclear transport factor 2 family protein n=1 Tax=Streptomyces smyrnaeus TaxID=1387713 RepID=UPI0036825858